ISRGPRLSALSLKYIACEMRCAAQKSLIEYQAAGTGGPRIGVAFASGSVSGSLLTVASIAAESAIGGPASRFDSSAVCTGFFPVISPRAIVVNSMKAHGARYGADEFSAYVQIERRSQRSQRSNRSAASHPRRRPSARSNVARLRIRLPLFLST